MCPLLKVLDELVQVPALDVDDIRSDVEHVAMELLALDIPLVFCPPVIAPDATKLIFETLAFFCNPLGT